MPIQCITIFDASDFELYQVYCKMSNFSFPLGLGIANGRGHVTDLTSDDLHEKSEIDKMWVPRGLLLFESFIFLRKIDWHWQRCKVHVWPPEVYLWRHRSVTWPDLKMNKFVTSCLNEESVMPNFSALSQTTRKQSRENRWGGAPPPPSAGEWKGPSHLQKVNELA